MEVVLLRLANMLASHLVSTSTTFYCTTFSYNLTEESSARYYLHPRQMHLCSCNKIYFNPHLIGDQDQDSSCLESLARREGWWSGTMLGLGVASLMYVAWSQSSS
jgi:hypothetical protein